MLHRLNRLIFRGIILVLVKLLTRTKVSGLENIPTEGGVLMTANHLSVVDPALVFMSLDRQDATGFVAKKHQSNLFYRTIVKSCRWHLVEPL